MVSNIRIGEDGKVYAKLLNHMDIYAKDLADLKVAAREALQCFIIASELYGQGLEMELLMCLQD